MVKILLFADLQERAGTSSLEFPADNLSVAELKTQLQGAYPELHLRGVMTAVNEEYAQEEDTVAAGDIVAFIPPVSGG